ncbi:hypothetical protein CA833_21705 [Novosphingobium sp. KA1]|nr:hypothetical protein CA833_21705 [Novosphingobium sp. KA1]
MMRGKMIRTATLSTTAALAGVLLVAGTTPALAQATWSLQPGADSTQAPARPAGPVDSQNPVVTRPANTPEETPSTKVTLPAPPPPAIGTPTARAPEKPAAKPTAPAGEAPRRTDAPAPRAGISPETPAPAPAPAPTPAPTAPAAQPAPSASPLAATPSLAAADATQTEPTAAPSNHWPEWWLAIPVALLLAAGGVFALLRRRATPATAWTEAGLEPEPEPEPEPEVGDIAQAPEAEVAPATKAPTGPVITAPAQPKAEAATTVPVTPAAPPRANPLLAPLLVPAQVPAATTTPPLAPSPADIEKPEIALETVLMRQSLVYATLVYRAALTAPADGIPEGAVIAADMISAHASLSQAEQLAPDPASIPVRHRFDALAPGETREVNGEIQLPLNAIRPLRQGNATLFVPLLRLFVALPDGSIERRVFSLGQPGEGAGLAPLRIDTGPRDHAPIQAREIVGARSHAGPAPAGGVPQAAE